MSEREWNCVVQGCTTRRTKGFTNLPSSDEARREIWKSRLKLINPAKRVKICTDHFEDQYFHHSREDGHLKSSAIPSLNLPTVSFS